MQNPQRKSHGILLPDGCSKRYARNDFFLSLSVFTLHEEKKEKKGERHAAMLNML
jgi:hypothetical protein